MAGTRSFAVAELEAGGVELGPQRLDPLLQLAEARGRGVGVGGGGLERLLRTGERLDRGPERAGLLLLLLPAPCLGADPRRGVAPAPVALRCGTVPPARSRRDRRATSSPAGTIVASGPATSGNPVAATAHRSSRPRRTTAPSAGSEAAACRVDRISGRTASPEPSTRATAASVAAASASRCAAQGFALRARRSRGRLRLGRAEIVRGVEELGEHVGRAPGEHVERAGRPGRPSRRLQPPGRVGATARPQLLGEAGAGRDELGGLDAVELVERGVERRVGRGVDLVTGHHPSVRQRTPRSDARPRRPRRRRSVAVEPLREARPREELDELTLGIGHEDRRLQT